jgi:thiol:disulfide interchange protein DsbA
LADFGPPTNANGNLKAVAKPSKLDTSDDKIEVVYFFWYGCPSCFKTDVATTMFLSSLPEDVRATKIHVLFDQPSYWRAHGKLFYVLEELGVEKELHTQIFETIQSKEAPVGGHYARSLLTPESQETFAAAHGVSRAAFKAAFGSPAVNGRMERVIAFTDNSGLDGVPGFVINGRYQYTYFSGPGFYQQADKLIAMERARLAAEKEKAAQ